MNKGIKFRIYPNKVQQNLIDRTLGCVRFIYNQGLAYRITQYKAGAKTNYVVTNAMLTGMKKQENYAFLKEVDSIALQQSLRDLDRAYQNFLSTWVSILVSRASITIIKATGRSIKAIIFAL